MFVRKIRAITLMKFDEIDYRLAVSAQNFLFWRKFLLDNKTDPFSVPRDSLSLLIENFMRFFYCAKLYPISDSSKVVTCVYRIALRY